MDNVTSTISHFSKGNLGISRKDMPQISSTDVPGFLKWLQKEYGVKVRKTTVPAKSIQHTQKELNPDKIRAFLTSEGGNLKKPVIISDDMYLMDGHHRHAAQYATSPNFPTPVYKLIGMGIEDLLEVSKMYHKTFSKGIHEEIGFPSFSQWLRESEEKEEKATKKSRKRPCECEDCDH